MLLGFFKALGNESRLKIIALLAEGELTVREIALHLDLKEPTVSEHLALLRESGLVSVRSEGNFRFYAFRPDALYAMNKTLLSREKLAALSSDDDARVLGNFLKNGRLVMIPAQRKKLLVVLRWLAEQFEPEQRYTEKEVNAIITQYHDDYATLRRELIGHGFMQREKGIYWRV